MQFLSPGPPSPTVSGQGSPQYKNFFGGSFFTTPPEEAGDLFTEKKGRRSWWVGDSSMTRKPSKVLKADEEKQYSDKEMSGEKLSKEKKEGLKGGSQGEKVKVEKAKAKDKRSKEGVQKGSADRPGSRKVENEVTRVEAVGRESPPVAEGKTGWVRMVDQQLKVGIAEDTGDKDDTSGSLTDAKSLRSLNSSKSTNSGHGNTKPSKKRWTLMIPRRATPEEAPVPSKKFTEDVAGSRFEAAKDPAGERCAGDYPPVYVNGFVSLLPPHNHLP